jgi:hypothetical protein
MGSKNGLDIQSPSLVIVSIAKGLGMAIELF